MVFSSLLFLFRFLPIALIIYFITPKKFRNLILLILSLIFYSWGEPKYFFIMISSIFVDYSLSLVIAHNRSHKKLCVSMLSLSLLFNLGMLFLFKYSGLNLTLPLGISFYTFQTLSYTIDVFRNKVTAEKNIIDFGAFVSLFPQLIAGPIVKYTDINLELKNRSITLDSFEDGISEFIIGLGKKVLIANNIGMLWNDITNIGFNNISMPLAWLGIIAFSMQIYYDFSGYSSMAIGLGKMLGFNFPVNFNFPYISKSISEFWRRWHITLGSWFREYVYIPLGGNRVSKFRLFFNLFIVWFLTGMWHGAEKTFILWGLFFFLLIGIEKIFLLDFLENHPIIAHIYTKFFLAISWCIFAIPNFNELVIYLKKMFHFNNINTDILYYLSNYGVVLFIAILFSTPVIYKSYIRLKKNSMIRVLILSLILVLSTAYLVDSTYNPFLYFRF